MKKCILCLLSGLTLVISCTHKGEPTKQGEMLTTEQMNALANDQSMNGKLVSVKGYASFCGVFSSVKGGKKSRMNIYTDGFCKGEKLLDAEILIADNQTPYHSQVYQRIHP